MFKRLMKFGVKSSILTGAVYYTIDQGLWEGTDKADEVYATLYQAVTPYIKEVPLEAPELPSLSNFGASTKLYYNQGVIATGNFLKDLPSKTSSLACELKSSISALLEASLSAPTPDGSSTDSTASKS